MRQHAYYNNIDSLSFILFIDSKYVLGYMVGERGRLKNETDMYGLYGLGGSNYFATRLS